jgi:hypothetical protein
MHWLMDSQMPSPPHSSCCKWHPARPPGPSLQPSSTMVAWVWGRGLTCSQFPSCLAPLLQCTQEPESQSERFGSQLSWGLDILPDDTAGSFSSNSSPHCGPLPGCVQQRGHQTAVGKAHQPGGCPDVLNSGDEIPQTFRKGRNPLCRALVPQTQSHRSSDQGPHRKGTRPDHCCYWV